VEVHYLAVPLQGELREVFTFSPEVARHSLEILREEGFVVEHVVMSLEAALVLFNLFFRLTYLQGQKECTEIYRSFSKAENRYEELVLETDPHAYLDPHPRDRIEDLGQVLDLS